MADIATVEPALYYPVPVVIPTFDVTVNWYCVIPPMTVPIINPLKVFPGIGKLEVA
jgi:hypothetical protein